MDFPAAMNYNGNRNEDMNMTEFNELIKNFDRIRDYMRQFFIYGYKNRGDFDKKSGRTYDNERRRVESWLGDYVKSAYTEKGKNIYISVDSKTIPQNPLYGAWKSKSFTDNDILLHFFLLDLLFDSPEGKTAKDLADEISSRYGMVFDGQTVRLKLKEYEELGLFTSFKQGKNLFYRLLPGPASPNGGTLSPDTWQALLSAVTFYQEAAPFGFVGSTILDEADMENHLFQFKHHFIVHTLEDGVLGEILTAMKERKKISFINRSRRSQNSSTVTGIPLKIYVSTQTGRRYLCLYLEGPRRFLNYRLDSITAVTHLEICEKYEEYENALLRNMNHCWGVSFDGSSRMEELYMKLWIDEEREPHILNRLYRESRGG